MLKSLIITAIICLFHCIVANGQQKNHPFVIIDVITIHSRVLNEDRIIHIYNPDAIGPNKLPAYPVLYMTDENDMTMVTGMVTYLSSYATHIPAMIVVGIEGNGIEGNNTMIRDLTPTHSLTDNVGKLDPSSDSWLKPSGGSEKFLQFLREEVMPYVEQHYKTAPFKILAGHSVGGLNSIYTLLAHPDSFDAYIAISPSLWWDKGYILSLAKERLEMPGGGNKFLFFCDCPETGPFNRYVKDFRSLLKQKKHLLLQYGYAFYPTETHGTIAAKAYYDGIRFIYPQWDIAPTDTTAVLIKTHYQRLSKRFGYTVQPPLGVANDWAYDFLSQGKIEDAIEIFQLNVKNFPASSDTVGGLGDGYARKGDRQKAMAAYKKALEMNPHNTEIEAKLQALQGGR